MENRNSYRLQGTGIEYIADHRVNGVEVVPGAVFLIELLSNRTRIKNVQFMQMVPHISSEDLEFSAVTDDVNNTSVFAAGEECVRFETDVEGRTERHIRDASIDTRMNSADVRHISGENIYKALDAKGNNYGPLFRGLVNARFNSSYVNAVWRAPKILSGKQILVTLLDSFTHAASLLGGKPFTYYLESISSLTLHSESIPEGEVELSVELSEKSDDRVVADIIAKTSSGATLLHAEGICIAYDLSKPSLEMSTAATFNLDPLSDYLQMWGRKLGINVIQHQGEYGQLIPSLIQKDGIFDGRSLSQSCFIRLQDWSQAAEQSELRKVPDEKLLHENLDTYTLPDTRVIASLNQYETSYLYKEIFLDQTYKRHDVLLTDDDIVIDIGANIGLFSMFASEQAKNVSVIAVEPSPTVLPILKSNLSAYTEKSVVVAAGASDERGEAEFTAYKKSSVFSGFMADTSDDRSAIKKIVCNMLTVAGDLNKQELDDAAEELMKDRMDSEQYTCPLVSVSDIIDEQSLSRVSLLKIDAEKSEEAILLGIKGEHWPIIEQVIIEVHKQSGIGVEGARQLLEEKGFHCVEDEEQFLSDSGLVTIYAVRPTRREANLALHPSTRIEKAVSVFLDALDGYSESANSMQVILCPSVVMDPTLRTSISQMEKRIAEHFVGSKTVDVTYWTDWCSRYPVENFHDVVSDSAGHIPYTREWYASTATQLLRNDLLTLRGARKVVVLDCDNTLWNGIVGEDGVDGIEFRSHNIELQKFVKDMVNRGYLLCLASKNDRAIVQQVFLDRAKDMVLAWEDVVANRINWGNKPDNLLSLSEELNLNIDSFVFVDDSPVECEQVRAIYPQVLTIQYTEDVGSFDYLSNVWDLDTAASTEEDKKRTGMYVDERRRQQHRKKFSNMEEFLESINLRVELGSVTEETIPRASQMCMRTNQFNCTSERYSESDIRSAIAADGTFVEKISVSDTFGEYGITGLVISRVSGDNLTVECCLLSCRVLGRGVEYRMAAHLGQKALRYGCTDVVFRFKPTDRNAPAELFLKSITSKPFLASADEFTVSIPAEELSSTKYKVQIEGSSRVSDNVVQESIRFQVPNAVAHSVAMELRTAKQIAMSFDSKARMPRPDLVNAYIAPEGEVQSGITSIWEELLGIEQVGVEDNFFALGGTSLKGVEMISRLQNGLGIKVNIARLFENPTVAGLLAVNERISDELKPHEIRKKGRNRRKGSKRRGEQIAASRGK